MPREKLTPVVIGAHFADRYAAIATKLSEWEQAKASFLVDVGRECLALVRQVLEPLPDHDLTGRKAARARTVKDIEAQLPELEGIGAPQVNRWIRWAGAAEVIGKSDDLIWPGGLKQAHLMVLEKFIEQHEPTAVFRFKEPWKNKLDDVREIVRGTVETGASSTELEQAIDEEAEFPKPPEPKEEPCPTAVPKSESSPPESGASAASSPPSTKGSAASCKATTTDAGGSKSGSTTSIAKSPMPAPAPTASNLRSAPSPASSNAAPAPVSATACTPKDLADQAFKLLQQPEILAGVFRREWNPDLVLAIVENLIRASGEKSKNPLALAKAYHRIAPFVLTHFEAYIDDGKFKLRKKDQPEPPTLEQLAPAGELATA